MLCIENIRGLSPIIWSLICPIYFTRAIAKARNVIMARYGDHVEIALQEFVANPNEKSLQRYSWLLENQRALDVIRFSLLSITSIALLIIANVLILIIAVSYVMLKWDSFPSVIPSIFN